MIYYKKQIFSRSGQSLVDILIGLALITLGIGFATILVFGGQSVLVDRVNETEARELARAGLNGATLIVKKNWENTIDGNYGIIFDNGKWIFSGTSTKTGIYTIKISVKTLSIDEKEIKSTVSWEADPQRTLTVEFVTLVTNWSESILTGGDTGGGAPSGDWQNPRILGSIDLGDKGTGSAVTDLDVKNKIIYMTSAASDPKKPDFWIIDATNAQNPLIKSSIDTGPSLNAVDVAGNYAYVANNATDAQLQIIDVSDINNPLVLVSFQLPNVSGENALGNAIFYYDRKIYIGTKKAKGPEFHIIDVTDPVNPSTIGSFEINEDINDIFVKGNTAYLATSEKNQELIILDVKDPSNVLKISSYNAPGTDSEGKTVQLLSGKIYLGRLHDSNDELHIIDLSDPAFPQNLGSKRIDADVNDLRVKGFLAFLATSYANREFQIWNIDDPTNITLWSSLNFSQVATGIDYEDNVVYVSVRSNDALRIITSQ